LSKSRKNQFSGKSDVPICQTEQSGFQPMYNATVCSVGSSPAKPDYPVSEIGGSEIFRIIDESSKMTTVDPDDWRTPLVRYLENPGHIAGSKVRRQALKYDMLDNTLYRRTINGLLLKCLSLDQSRIPMERFIKVFVVLINHLTR
jgi:hypothetical protein